MIWCDGLLKEASQGTAKESSRQQIWPELSRDTLKFRTHSHKKKATKKEKQGKEVDVSSGSHLERRVYQERRGRLSLSVQYFIHQHHRSI